jgi:hypothetical protein
LLHTTSIKYRLRWGAVVGSSVANAHCEPESEGAMPKRRHALSGALYEVGADGNVYVEKEGHRGVFTPTGRYLSGDLYSADPHMCLWLAGPQVPGGANMKDMPVPAGFDG